MLYIRNHPCTPSTDGKIITLRCFPCLSHVWPTCILHMSYGHSKTLHYPFPLLSFSYSSLSYNNWSKVVLCMCTRYTINSTTAITIQTHRVVPGYRLPLSCGGVRSMFRTPWPRSNVLNISVNNTEHLLSTE